ncbi:MAG: pantoate--beta-alanine ligase, partial [Candidatus Aminicenantes bacterium]|nr:pantoate--beta-alanine ligase [Candidatus Aminicenantes bacterium]
RQMVENGEQDAGRIMNRMREMIDREPLARIDYLEIVDMDDIDPVIRIEKEALAALAVFVGKVRLIDNAILRVKE